MKYSPKQQTYFKINNRINKMTPEQIIKACKNNQYVKFRFRGGDVVGFNCKLVNHPINKAKLEKIKGETTIQSFEPCNFIEYIRTKKPYMA
jgi:hypothetical protein